MTTTTTATKQQVKAGSAKAGNAGAKMQPQNEEAMKSGQGATQPPVQYGRQETDLGKIIKEELAGMKRNFPSVQDFQVFMRRLDGEFIPNILRRVSETESMQGVTEMEA